MRGGLLRGHAATILVAALASAFGVGLVSITEVIAIASGQLAAEFATARVVLGVVAWVFIAIAVYVAAVVTTNTVATIVAGRVRIIALSRLLGATSGQERSRLARQGLAAGLVGAAIGMLVAWGLVLGFLALGRDGGWLPERDYRFVVWTDVLPVAVVIAATWLAAWVGSRRVLGVTPIEALAAAVPAPVEALGRRTARAAVSWALVGVGAALLVLGVLAGFETPLGVLVSVLGGILSFSGVIAGAVVFVPPLLRLAGFVFGRGAAATIGARNAVRYPERSARAAIGLVIGVTLVTMFSVASATYQEAFARQFEAVDAQTVRQVLDTITAILSGLLGYSAVIAAVGLVNTLTVGVLQRTREFGLLRALGLSRGQLRASIAFEAVALALVSVVFGAVIGTAYGWAGAQAILGTLVGDWVAPVISPWLLALVGGAAVLLALVGSLVPASRAVRIAPVEAIAVE